MHSKLIPRKCDEIIYFCEFGKSYICSILTFEFSGQIVLMATTLTALIFGSFTLSSLLSNKRTFIYLGGILASAISMLFWISFINAFIGSRLLFTVELYLGLFMFCGYGKWI
jgi:Bax inhibitor 1